MLSPVDFSGSFSSISRFLRFAVIASAALLFSLSSQIALAQLADAERAANGDSFIDFLNRHGTEKALDEAENMVDLGKWTDKDFSAFAKFKKSKNAAIIKKNAQDIARGEENVRRNAQDIARGEENVRRNAQDIARGEENVRRNAQDIEKGNQTIALE